MSDNTGNSVQLRQDGPLKFTGELAVMGERIGDTAFLCRCGASSKKPLCDGSHKEAGRSLPGAVPAKDGKVLEATGGVLNLEPQPNGPVKATGNLEVLGADGAVLDRVTQAWFCRCGHTGKPPYCDGSHKRVGFVSP